VFWLTIDKILQAETPNWTFFSEAFIMYTPYFPKDWDKNKHKKTKIW